MYRMPEGPSIIIFKEQLAPFNRKKVVKASGSSKDIVHRVNHQKITGLKTWGKHLLISFDDFTLRIHLLLFGSYLVNENNKRTPKLGLHFSNGFVNFYACSFKIIEEPLNEVYDWSGDIMSTKWDAKSARAKLKKKGTHLVCDALVDQQIFSGAGNIIKNEVLYRAKVHPMSVVEALPATKITQLINQTHKYAFEFLKWKKAGELEKHWQAYTKEVCERCDIPLMKEYLGEQHRRTYFCPRCQEYYGE